MRRTAGLVTALVAAVVALLTPPAEAAEEVQYHRWAVNGQSYNHLGNPLLGQVRSDTWVDEQYEYFDLSGTEPYKFWHVRAVSRVVKVNRAVRVQVAVTRIEDVYGHVYARNATPVNSGTAPYAIQVSPWADVSPWEYCVEFETHSPLRVRTLFYVRWSDGTLSRIVRVGPWTNADGGPEWCYP